MRIAPLVIAAVAGVAAVAAAAPAPDAPAAEVLLEAVAGRVINASTGKPIRGARVTVEDTTTVATSDKDGRFSLAGVATVRRWWSPPTGSTPR